MSEIKGRIKCRTHPGVNPETMWGCPDCVRELRAEVSRLTQENAVLRPRIEGVAQAVVELIEAFDPTIQVGKRVD